MKRIVSSLVASIALVSTLSASDFYASVNGENITKKDIAMVLQDPRIQFEQLPENAKKQVIEQIINKKLLSQHAVKEGIEKDPQYLEAIKSIKENLAFQVWQKKQVEGMKFSEDEKKDFYEKNKDKFIVPETLEARHILVKTEDEAKKIIKQLDKATKKEDKFVELAKTLSQDPAGANGGYLGKFQAEQMVPEFSAAAKLLSKDNYSKTPVKTQFGYHVIYLKDKIASKSLSFNEVEGNISQILLGNSYNKKVKELTDELKKDAKIVIK